MIESAIRKERNEESGGQRCRFPTKPRAVKVLLKEETARLSDSLTSAMGLTEGNFNPVDLKSAAAKPDPSNAAFDREFQFVSYLLLMVWRKISIKALAGAGW